MTALTINVIGNPIPQGSKVANHHAPGVRDANDKNLRPWRATVANAAAEAATAADWATLNQACRVVITFAHPRPASHFGTGRNAARLKPSAPSWKSTRPDIDKLTRAVLDALTDAQVIRDDGRVASLRVSDTWANGPAGALITVATLTHDSGQRDGVIL